MPVADAGSSHYARNAGCVDDFPDLPRLLPISRRQYALVSVRNSAETLRAYTISSTPGVSEYITLTVRRIDDGVGSQWLTRDVKRGDYLWLSDAMGEFTCDDKAEDKFLLLAAGCGVTPIMSMRRWLAKNRPQADVRVITTCVRRRMLFSPMSGVTIR